MMAAQKRVFFDRIERLFKIITTVYDKKFCEHIYEFLYGDLYGD